MAPETSITDPLVWHRIQFGFTVVYHYLFPQLTMGLAPLIAWFKWRAIKTGEQRYHDATRFWLRIFGINFAVGVVTGIPMEFQFGTNWAQFSRVSGGVVGQTLAMEGMFAFFLESSLLALVIFGAHRLRPKAHLAAIVALCAGSWLSGYFIIVANAFMQHPTGYVSAANGTLQLAGFWNFVLNPWALAQYAHTMIAAMVTGSFVVAAVGAYWMLRRTHEQHAKLYLRVGIVVGLVASVLVAFPTGDQQGKLVARDQPVSLAAMEGRFDSGTHAPLNLIGQPNVAERKLENPIRIPGALSFIAYGTFSSDVRGLDEFPQDQWPTSIELLYYSFHIMAGLGTLFIGLMALSVMLLRKERLFRLRPMLWTLMLAFPFPYIATTAGWMTAELGRQPWLIYGIMRTADGASPTVHSGSTIFTLIGFCGLYFVLGLLFLYLIGRDINRGPELSTTH